MKKKTGTLPKKKKRMSEGKVIVLVVLLIGGGISILIYALQLLFNFFFPNF